MSQCRLAHRRRLLQDIGCVFFYYFSESRRRRRKRKSPNFHSKYERLDARASLHRKRKEKSFPFFFLLLLFLLPFAISKKIRRIIVAYNLSKTKQMEKSSEETSEIKIKKKTSSQVSERAVQNGSSTFLQGGVEKVKRTFSFAPGSYIQGYLGVDPCGGKTRRFIFLKKNFSWLLERGVFFFSF